MPKKFTAAYNIPQKVNYGFDDDSDYFLGTPYHHVAADFVSEDNVILTADGGTFTRIRSSTI